MGVGHPLLAEDPRSVGSYRLLGRLGMGGMGCVYLGRTAGGRTVAVKVVRADLAQNQEFRARFRREAAAARRVGGVWTAPVLDADTESEQPWVATGYVAGPSLAQAVGGSGALPEETVRALGAGLAEALAHVHGLGLIHRDLKPSNVMLSLDGPVLIDFGIARAMDGSATSSLTRTGFLVGSPGYMSPEQVLDRPLTPASDVFQLGAVLAFAATGAGPFAGDSAASLLYQVANGEPELTALPDGIRSLVEACLAKSPSDRPSPADIAASLVPGGAGSVIRDGWLPAPITAQLGRQAIELLNLDTGDAAPTVTAATPQPVRTPNLPSPVDRPTVRLAPRPRNAPPPRPGQAGRRRRGMVVVLVAAAVAVAAVAAVVLSGNTHSTASGGGGSPTPAGTSPAPSLATVGPVQPVNNLCDAIDPAPLTKVLGPPKETPSASAANNSDGTFERRCTYQLQSGHVEEIVTYYPNPAAARRFYEEVQRTPHTGVDSTPSVPVGEQAGQNLLKDPNDPYKCWQYALDAVKSNVFVAVDGVACQFPDSTAVQNAMARTTRAMLDHVAGV